MVVAADSMAAAAMAADAGNSQAIQQDPLASAGGFFVGCQRPRARRLGEELERFSSHVDWQAFSKAALP
jgi:hypothetical protein